MVKFFKNRLIQILLLAGALRFFMLGSVPISLNWDEVSQGYTAYSIMKTGADEWGTKLPLFFRSYGEWKSAVYIYLLVPFIKILGLNAWSVRLPAALASIACVYGIYLLGKKLYSERVGLWAAFLMAVTPWSLMLGRPAFEANVALALMLGGVYLFLTQRYAVSAILFGLAPHTYNSAKIVIPLMVVYLIWSTKLYKKIRSTFIVLGILAVFALPILTNVFSGRAQARYNQVGITTNLTAVTQFYSLRSTLPLPSIVQKLIINKPTFLLYHLTNNMLQYLSPGFLAMHGGDRPQQSLPYHGVLYISELIFVLVGIYAIWGYHSLQRLLPLALILLGIIPAALTRESEHVLRAILAIPGFVLLGGVGLEYLEKHQSKKLMNWLVGALMIEIAAFLLIYFFWYPRVYARDWQYGYAQVASYLKDHENEYDKIVVTKWYGEPQLFLAFYNHWDPTWYVQENKANLRYESEGQVWLDQLTEYNIGKYTFKYLDWSKETRDHKTLYIGKFDDFPGDVHVLERIVFPDGTVAFYLVSGDR